MYQTRLLPTIVLGVTAMIVSSASAVDKIIAQDDTWVREDNATSNRDGNDQMNARSDIDADDNDVILLRFSTASLTSAVTEATLRMYWQRTSGDSATKIMRVYGLNNGAPRETTWLEETVIYGVAADAGDDAISAPGLIPDDLQPATECAIAANLCTIDSELFEAQDLDLANLTFLGEKEVPEPGAVQNAKFDFKSAALASFLETDRTAGNGEVTLLILRDATTSSHQLRFWPKEEVGGNATASKLLIPEPGSLVLLGLGASMFVRRRARG